MDAITLDWSDGIPADGEAQLFAALNQRCAERQDNPALSEFYSGDTAPAFTVNGYGFTIEQQHYGRNAGRYFWEHWGPQKEGKYIVALREGEYFDTAAQAQQDAINYARELDRQELDRKDAIMEQARATGRRDVVRAAAVELYGEQGA